MEAEAGFAEIRVACVGATSTQSKPSLRPIGFTVNSSRMLPSPDNRLAGVAVSALGARLDRDLFEIAIVEPEVLPSAIMSCGEVLVPA